MSNKDNQITIEKPIPPLPNFCCRCGTTEPKSLPAEEVLCNNKMSSLPPIFWVKLDKDNDIEHTLIDEKGKVENIFIFSHVPFFQIAEDESVICATCAKQVIQKKIKKKIMENDEGFIPGIDDNDNMDDNFEEML